MGLFTSTNSLGANILDAQADIEDFLENPKNYTRKMQMVIFDKHLIFGNVFPTAVRVEMEKNLDFKQLLSLSKEDFLSKLFSPEILVKFQKLS